jgi:hypothetical protein
MHKLCFSVLAILTLTAVLAGCASGGQPAQSVTLEIKVTGDKADKGEFTAGKGDHITMTITADKDQLIHLHGYDIQFDCRAKTPCSKTFDAYKTGTFELELEGSSSHIGHLIVTQ